MSALPPSKTHGGRAFSVSTESHHFKNYDFWRICPQARPNLGADAVVSAPRFGRLWEQTRMRLLPRSSTTIGKDIVGLPQGIQQQGRSKFSV